MAEEDYQDYDDGDVFEWLYVEDDYPLADELAETQIPSPGYPGTSYEVDQSGYELDLYEYFMDLEYGEDEYWNTAMAPTPLAEAGGKRKRAPVKTKPVVDKRRRLSLKDTDGGNVRFVPMTARAKTTENLPSKRRSSFALLPDWRQRFAGVDGMLVEKEMPVEMKMAAESKVEETPPKGHSRGAVVTDGDEEEGDWVDEGEDDEQFLDGEEDLGADDDLLRSLLMEKLKGTPLNTLDQDKLIQTVNQLLQGGGSDDALDDLTKALLGGQDEDNQKEVFGWLSEQGAKLDVEEGDEEDDNASIEVAAQPPRRLTKDKIQSSPQDSAIGSSKTVTADSTMPAPSPFSSAKKRKGADEDRDDSSKKSKQGVSDRSSDHFARNVSELSLNEPGSPDKETISVAKAPNAANDSIAVTSNGNTNTKGSRNSKSTSAFTTAAVSQAELTGAGNADEDMYAAEGITAESKPARAASVKQTRKRKADVDDDLDEAASTQRKQPRRAAAVQAAAEIETTTRRTRATRSKGGK